MAMFRALPSATVFYPSDGVSTEKAMDLAATTKVCGSDFAFVYVELDPFKLIWAFVMFPVKGLCYIRTSRHDCPIIYNSNEDFHVGQVKVIHLQIDHSFQTHFTLLCTKNTISLLSIVSLYVQHFPFLRWCSRAKMTK